MDWHIRNSDAFVDILVEPLKDYADIELTAWDGVHLPTNSNRGQSPMFFCMLPPTDELLEESRQKIVWLPMWDQARGYDQTWWNNLSKNLHIVAFSEPICQRAKKAGLPLIRLKYFKNPAGFRPIDWRNEHVVFYWNRTGMIGPKFLKKFCTSVSAKELLFLGKLDPRIDKKFYYELPDNLGSTKVIRLNPPSRDEYLGAVASSNIFIAPRISEGVGMTFLEALAKGCAVVAYNAPTMNEYITDGENGILLKPNQNTVFDKLRNVFKRKKEDSPIYKLDERQDWDALSKVNYSILGNRARKDHIVGYESWISSIPEYAKFVLG